MPTKLCKYCTESPEDMIKIRICKCRGIVGSVCLSCFEKNIILNQTKTCSECKNSYFNIENIPERLLMSCFEYKELNAKEFIYKILLFIPIFSIAYILNMKLSEEKVKLMINRWIFLLILYEFLWLSMSYIHFLYWKWTNDHSFRS
jgi:hypothetical protein